MQRRSFITVVNQGEQAFREFLGSNRIRLEPGLQINLPIFHKTHRVDMREQGVFSGDLHCFTKDNVPVNVSGTLFFKVVDAEKACFDIVDYKTAVHAVGSSSIRAVIGGFDYDESIKERSNINDKLQHLIGDSIIVWGIECSKFEMNVFEPQNRNVAQQMEKQMEAERSRRENELNTQAKIRTAEGEKCAMMHKTDGDFYMSNKISEAESYSMNQSTDALKYRIDQIKLLLPKLTDNEIMTIILEEKRLEHLNSIAKNPKGKSTYFVDPSSIFPMVNALIPKNK